MKPEHFQQATEHLLLWHPKSERHVLAPRQETCEDCHMKVKAPRRVVCELYRMNTYQEHYRHTCRACKRILFAGEIKKRQKKIDLAK
jgi:transposase